MGNKINQLMSEELKVNLKYDISNTEFKVESAGLVREIQVNSYDGMGDKELEVDEYFQGGVNRATYVILLSLLLTIIAVVVIMSVTNSIIIQIGITLMVSFIVLIAGAMATPAGDVNDRQDCNYKFKEYNKLLGKINNLKSELLYDIKTGEIISKYHLIDWENSTRGAINYQSREVIELKDIEQKTINKELELYIKEILTNKERYVKEDTDKEIGDKYLRLKD